jgi:hypothetical protein
MVTKFRGLLVPLQPSLVSGSSLPVGFVPFGAVRLKVTVCRASTIVALYPRLNGWFAWIEDAG